MKKEENIEVLSGWRLELFNELLEKGKKEFERV